MTLLRSPAFLILPKAHASCWPPADQVDGKVAFFGHSMGALVAFDVARRFEAAGKPVAALFVSACAAPGEIGYDYIPESDRGLLDAVSAMTGANPEFLENEEFAAKILPTLRGLKAIANYECPPDATVSCPIFAFLGDDDEVATYEKVTRWSQRTTSEFSARVFPGHHFYLNDHLPELVGNIEENWSVTSRIKSRREVETDGHAHGLGVATACHVPPGSSDAKLISISAAV